MAAKRDKDSAKNARSTYKRNRRNIALSLVYGIITCLLIVFLVSLHNEVLRERSDKRK